MKLGPRTPNVKKRISARTTGSVKRKIKTSTSPLYGQKGVGWVKDPERAAYNKIYNQTSFGLDDAEGCAYGCGCLVIIIMLFILYNFISSIFTIH